MAYKMSLNKKLILGFFLAGLIPALIITGVVVNQVSKSLREAAQEKLIAVREAKAFQLEEMYKVMGGQVAALSQNKIVVEAVSQFEDAFKKYETQTTKSISSARASLSSFYNNEFGKKYENTNIGKKFNRLDTTYGALSKNKVLLQDAFISSNSSALGEKDKLYKLKNESDYAKAHERYHSTFRTYLNEFGYYDIFLADIDSGNIIYSVYKELDFATSLKTGPYSKSGIGKAFEKGAASNERGIISFTDIAKYYPSYDAPAQFISAPIFDGNKKVAVLIFQIPVDKTDAVLTGRKEWKKQGQGNSGETYVIGKDKTMKSISRFIVEDPSGFFEIMKSLDVSKENLDYMKSKETSAIAAKIDTIGAEKVIGGETGFDIFPDYREVNVLSAFRPLKIKGLSWYILSEMDEDEALESLKVVKNIIFILIAGCLVIIIVCALLFARGISRSLSALAEKLQDGAMSVSGAADSVSSSSVQLSSSTQQQASSLQETSTSIHEISAMVQRNSDNASTTSSLSEKSQQKAEMGKRYVSSVKGKIENIHRNNENLVQSVADSNSEIESLTKMIDNISEKTKIINDIVFQTKLLSFNASVEAARAGEHGKGFSVVAEEVGALAQMSGAAATEISELLEQSTNQVHKTVDSSKSRMKGIIEEGRRSVDESLSEINTCDGALTEILENFKEVNKSVQEIASSSAEQSSGVSEINSAVQQLDSVIQQYSAVVHQSSARANDLKEQSKHLSGIVEQIQALVFGSK